MVRVWGKDKVLHTHRKALQRKMRQACAAAVLLLGEGAVKAAYCLPAVKGWGGRASHMASAQGRQRTIAHVLGWPDP